MNSWGWPMADNIIDTNMKAPTATGMVKQTAIKNTDKPKDGKKSAVSKFTSDFKLYITNTTRTLSSRIEAGRLIKKTDLHVKKTLDHSKKRHEEMADGTVNREASDTHHILEDRRESSENVTTLPKNEQEKGGVGKTLAAATTAAVVTTAVQESQSATNTQAEARTSAANHSMSEAGAQVNQHTIIGETASVLQPRTLSADIPQKQESQQIAGLKNTQKTAQIGDIEYKAADKDELIATVVATGEDDRMVRRKNEVEEAQWNRLPIKSTLSMTTNYAEKVGVSIPWDLSEEQTPMMKNLSKAAAQYSAVSDRQMSTGNKRDIETKVAELSRPTSVAERVKNLAERDNQSENKADNKAAGNNQPKMEMGQNLLAKASGLEMQGGSAMDRQNAIGRVRHEVTARGGEIAPEKMSLVNRAITRASEMLRPKGLEKTSGVTSQNAGTEDSVKNNEGKQSVGLGGKDRSLSLALEASMGTGGEQAAPQQKISGQLLTFNQLMGDLHKPQQVPNFASEVVTPKATVKQNNGPRVVATR